MLTYTVDGNWQRWVCAVHATKKVVCLRFLYGVLLDDPLSVLRPGTSVLMTWDMAFDAAIDEAQVRSYVVEPPARRLAPPTFEVEALEPEEEDDGSAAMPAGGLGGFFSRIIPRSTAKRTHDEIEAEYEDLPDPETEEFLPPEEEPAPEFAPDFGGPLLARKGKANSAPPVDFGAINHEVDARKGRPESDFWRPKCPKRSKPILAK